MPIVLYSFQLWYYKGAPLSHPLKKLKKIQCRVVLWIMEVFYTSPSWGVEAIAGLIPIHLYLSKVSGRHHLRIVSLPKQHALNSLLDNQHLKKAKPHCLSMDNLTSKQYQKIKSLIMDTNSWLNEIFPFFNRLHKELLLGF